MPLVCWGQVGDESDARQVTAKFSATSTIHQTGVLPGAWPARPVVQPAPWVGQSSLFPTCRAGGGVVVMALERAPGAMEPRAQAVEGSQAP